LPDPVGAQISVCAPPAIAGQPSAWAAVGASNEALNQSRVAALKAASGSGAGAPFGCLAAARRVTGPRV
jgi:hypothetical protein